MINHKLLRLLSPLAILFASVCATCEAQVVQLPAFRQFSYSGGALVPDAGTGYLAGNSYSSSGSVGRGGIPGNRAFGAASGAGHMSASVQIIDLDALDQAILNSSVPSSAISQANRMLPVSDAAAAEQARKFLSSYPTIHTARNGDPSYRDLKSTLGNSTKPEPVDASLAESNVRYYLKKGQEAETANRIQSARVYYKMALEAMTPELMERYHKVLADREKAEKDKKVAKDADRKQF
jgi:hypothetical protein